MIAQDCGRITRRSAVSPPMFIVSAASHWFL